jgi:hypothetical protein
VNNGKDVNDRNLQITKCMLCYPNLVDVLNPSTKERKGFITYYKTYEIIALKKHVNIIMLYLFKKIEEEING